MTPEELLARVLYRDALTIVLDKPAGLAVHAGPRGGKNLEQLFDHLRFDQSRSPALAHRLDRDTSGCLVLGRHRKALQKLGKLFSQGKVDKTYWSVVIGKPPALQGRIDRPILKITPKSGWRMVTDPKGQPAVTEYRVMGQGDGLSWLEVKLHTGRTHQIRVHMEALGCPVLGDPIYGGGIAARPGLFQNLHARRVVFQLQPKYQPIDVTAPVPDHMRPALLACGWQGEAQQDQVRS